MSDQKRILLLVLIMTVVALGVGGAAIGVLYATSVNEQTLRLAQTAHSQARLLEAAAALVGPHTDTTTNLAPAVILQVEEAYDHYPGVGRTAEFTLGRREGENIVLILRHRHRDVDNPELILKHQHLHLATPLSVAFDSKLAEPMRLALSGQRGTVIGPDYRGVTVLAAYEPVTKLKAGVVAKVDLSEIRGPFLTAGVIVASLAFVLIAGGTTLFFHIGNPMIQRIRASEEHFRSITQSANDAIISIDTAGNVVSWNDAAEKIFGYTDSEVLGKSLTRLIPERYREAHKRGLERVKAGGESRVIGKTVQLAGLRKDGSEFPAEVSLSSWPMEGEGRYFSGIIRDITRRRATEESLRKLSGAVEYSPVTVIVTDPAGAIEYVNPKFTQVTGYTPDEVIGRNLSLLDEQGAAEQTYELAWKTVTAGKIWAGEVTNKRKSGETFWESAAIAPIKDATGNITHFVAIKQDITARKNAEEQLRHAQKMEAVGELTGGLAHDFNNLLGIILGNLDLLHEQVAEKGSARELVKDAMSAAERGADLTHRLLAFSRRQTLAPRPLDLNKLIREMGKLLNRTLGRSIEVRQVLAPGLWKTMVDQGQLENALTNLVVNSRDAIPNGGIVTIKTANVTLGQSASEKRKEAVAGEYVRLSVHDTGTGMPPEIARRIFEPFFTTKKVGKGTGLGLSMVYGFVTQSGGYVTVDSKVGNGTTVSVHLPRAAPSVTRTAGPMEPETVQAKSRHVVLVVEDDAKLRKVAVRVLRKAGYDVVKAGNAEKALQRLKGLPRIDLLLTDIVLRGEHNGMELAEQVRRLRPAIKVLYTTGYADQDISPVDELGKGAKLLPKPYRAKDLLREVAEVLMVSGPLSVSYPSTRETPHCVSRPSTGGIRHPVSPPLTGDIKHPVSLPLTGGDKGEGEVS